MSDIYLQQNYHFFSFFSYCCYLCTFSFFLYFCLFSSDLKMKIQVSHSQGKHLGRVIWTKQGKNYFYNDDTPTLRLFKNHDDCGNEMKEPELWRPLRMQSDAYERKIEVNKLIWNASFLRFFVFICLCLILLCFLPNFLGSCYFNFLRKLFSPLK